MPRVAFLTPMYFADESYIGGGERYPLNLAIGLAEATGGRYQVELVSYGRAAARRALHAGVSLRVLPADPPRNPLDSVSWDLLGAVAGCDLLHVMQAYTRSSEAGYLVGKLCGVPVCVTDLGGQSSPLASAPGVVDLADRVVCYSDFGVANLPTTAPVTVIKGGVDGKKFAPPAGRRTRDRVLYVGRLLPHKGIDRLIRAVPADLPLTVCGRPYHPDYLALLHRLAEGKRVEFVTAATDADLKEQYARAWVNVLPSVYQDCYGNLHDQPELMGLTLLESMACGTPAICSRVGAMPEFVRHGETGYVFDEVDELTGYLTRLAGDPRLVERMGAAARRAVDDEFDLRVCGAKLAGVYDQLLAGRPAARRGVAA